MTKLLLRLFVRDYENTSDPAVLTIEGAASSASPDTSPDGQKDPSESGGSLRWLWISILALTIVALVVVIVIYLKRRKEYME